MCKLFNDWSPQIKKYCIDNNLSFDKAEKLSKSWGKDDIILQYYEKNEKREKKGLLDDTPMPIVLKIKNTSSGLEFEQTEYTQKYLSI